MWWDKRRKSFKVHCINNYIIMITYAQICTYRIKIAFTSNFNHLVVFFSSILPLYVFLFLFEFSTKSYLKNPKQIIKNIFHLLSVKLHNQAIRPQRSTLSWLIREIKFREILLLRTIPTFPALIYLMNEWMNDSLTFTTFHILAFFTRRFESRYYKLFL